MALSITRLKTPAIQDQIAITAKIWWSRGDFYVFGKTLVNDSAGGGQTRVFTAHQGPYAARVPCVSLSFHDHCLVIIRYEHSPRPARVSGFVPPGTGVVVRKNKSVYNAHIV